MALANRISEGDRAKWRDYQKDESKSVKRKSQRGGKYQKEYNQKYFRI